MLVICVGMSHAGSDWLREVAGRILEGAPSEWTLLQTLDGPGADLVDGEALAIHAHQDPRDVAFDRARELGLGFAEYVEQGLLDLCLANDRDWRARPDTLILAEAELVAGPSRCVRRIAEHLGVELDLEEAQAIARAHPPGDRQAGGWRTQATPEQRAALARVCGPWLVEHGYEPDDGWAGEPGVGPSADLPRVSYAQNMEDILLDRLFRGRKGTFVDVGANHPTHNNNTYFFYQRGWRGVNVEPVPSARPLFEEVRPDDLNLSVAISDEPGTATFYEIPDCTGLSSLSPEVADEQRARGFSVVEHQIPTLTVAQLVERHRLAPPEVFSLDVEGNEGSVLRGIPLATWQPQVFVIEATRPMSNIPCHETWEPILLEHGYRFAAFDGINRYYLRGDLAGFLPRFAYPVNSLDFYERAGLVEQRERADELARLRDEDHARFEADRAYLDRELTHYRREAAHHAAARVDDRAQALSELSRERDTWQAERDSIQRERDAFQVERDSIQRERDASQRERDAGLRERDAFQRERDARQAERETWHHDRDARIAEQGAWVAEQGAWVAERGAWNLERAALIARADRAETQSEALYDQIARLRDELARAEARAAEVLQALQEVEGTLRAQRAEAVPPPRHRAGRLGFLRR